MTGVGLVQSDPPVEKFMGNRVLYANMDVGTKHDPRHRVFLKAFTDRARSEGTIKQLELFFWTDLASTHRIIGDADFTGIEVPHERVV